MVTVECLCPLTPAGETRHPDGDTIELRERLDFAAGRTARNIVLMGKSDGRSTPEIMTELTEWYMLRGIAKWTVQDEHGKAVESNDATIRAYLFERSDTAAAELVGDEVDELYSDRVLTPLVVRGQTSSLPTSTNGSMSAMNGSSKPRKRSRPSSTTTIPTGDIETTTSLPAGDSSSSPSSD